MLKTKLLACSLLWFFCCLAYADNSAIPTLQSVQVLDDSIGLQAVSQYQEHVWVSGTQGAIFHSNDSGATFVRVEPPEQTRLLEFRDLQVLPQGPIVLMSAGENSESRVYLSSNAGKDWELVLRGTEGQFFDCVSFNDKGQGWLYGDADHQGLFVSYSADEGATWERQTLGIDAQPKEGGFASSGSCIIQQGDRVFIGTGNAQSARLLYKDDNNKWLAMIAPLPGGEASGIFSLQVSELGWFAFGGSLLSPKSPALGFYYHDSQWHKLPTLPLTGAVYGSALVKHGDTTVLLAANPQGVVALEYGQHRWHWVSKNNVWSLSCDHDGTCFGVGKGGRVETYK